MIYIFNKNKILSYIGVTFFVLTLFVLTSSPIPNKNIEIVKISSNVIENNNTDEKINNIQNSYKK